MSELKTVLLSSIDPNPMRRLGKYPYNEKKIETLVRSIADVGLWEGVIARKQGNRIQIAFGHHRVEAARKKLGADARIPVIMRDLTDEQMIQFMGRENLEEYNADFLVMLESWEAALLHYSKLWANNPRNHRMEPPPRDGAEFGQPIVLARLLGWIRSDSNGKDHRLNEAAEACNAALALIQGGYIKSSDLEGLSVRSVREICGRVIAQHEQIEKMAKTTQRPAKEVEQTKKISGRAGERVAKDVKAGKVAHRDIRGQIDVEAYRHAREAKKQTPLFSMFGKSLADQVAKIAKADGLAEKFHDIKKALGNITFEEDIEVVRRIALECGHAASRFEGWQTTFTNPKRKVVKLKEVSHG